MTDSEIVVMRCPECGLSSPFVELDGSAPADRWLQCSKCGHVWRWGRASVDPFSLILSTRAIPVTPCEEHRPAAGIPRARRYIIRLPIRYRMSSRNQWHTGLTENVSQSGILFRTERSGPLFGDELPAQPNTPVELLLDVPGAGPTEPVSRVRCEGQVVRTIEPEAPDMLPLVAAAIAEYRLAVV